MSNFAQSDISSAVVRAENKTLDDREALSQLSGSMADIESVPALDGENSVKGKLLNFKIPQYPL